MPAPLTEYQWQRFKDPRRMVNFIRRACRAGRTNAGRRSLRLYAVACCRHFLADWMNPDRLEVLEFAERFSVNKSLSLESIGRIRHFEMDSNDFSHKRYACLAIVATMAQSPVNAALTAAQHVLRTARGNGRQTEMRGQQAELLRELVGNPFQPGTAKPGWLRYRSGLVETMLTEMYAKKQFTDVPILADLLEEAGCEDQRLLEHLRSDTQHYKGCWALETLMGSPQVALPKS